MNRVALPAGRRFIPAVSGVLACAACLVLVTVALQSRVCAENARRSKFSRPEITWATTWINNALPYFFRKGIVARISAKDEGFDVFVGKPWYQLTFTQQGEFLKNLSRAREIIGHPPQFSVYDAESSSPVARVAWSSIEILTPGGDFKSYQPAAGDAAQTTTTP